MTTQEILNALNSYAIEDLEHAKQNGVMCITGTKHGNVEVTYRVDKYMATNFNTGEKLTQWIDELAMAQWLVGVYVVEQ